MLKAIHDVTNIMFRDPAGASRAGFPISLTLLISGEADGVSPTLKVQSDANGEIRAVPMRRVQADAAGSDATLQAGLAFSCADSAFSAWSAEFTPQSSGLYWYWFELLPNRNSWNEGSDNGSDDEEVERIFIGRDLDAQRNCSVGSPHAWQITVYEPVYEEPDWIRGGVFYHIFVDRFAKAGEPVYMDGKITRSDWGGEPQWQPDEHGEILNNDFFGGNLAGIREKLPYLADLGVTCLYLSPIFEAFSSHKYDTSDYMKVDPMFGDEEGFTCLCREAERFGMRIICDGVFSHTGSDSRYFDILDRYGNGACHHPDSPYRDWYYFEDDGWQCWWGIKTLPRINKEIPSYQEFMAGEDGVIRHWLRAGASGWRLDVVDELPKSFLEKLTAAAKSEKKDALMLGEVWEDASNKVAYEERKNYFEGNKLDSVMNYPLRRGIIDYVRGGDARALAEPMQTIMENYPSRVIHALMNILGTHDTERIITALAGEKLGPGATREEKASIHMDEDQWTAGIERLKTAVVLQMTLPGVPCVYYGDEAGMEGYNDPFNRRCYPWGHENPELLNWYRRVIAIRRSHDVYRDGSYRLLAARDGLFAFERAKAGAGADESARLITASNRGPRQQTLPLFGVWRDLLSGAVFTDDILVLPGQAMILEGVR